MGRWALLLHELPDSSWHYDWLIQPTVSDAAAPLIAFRVSSRPDDPSTVAFQGERIADHRAEYLSFEGEISDNRGRVRRVGQGVAEIIRDDGAFVITLDGQRTWVGRRRGFESSSYHFSLPDGPDFGHTEGHARP